MNKFIFGASMFLATAFSVTAFAQSTMGQTGSEPCKHLMKSCEAAGFQMKTKGSKGMRSCMGPLMKGEQVPGVTADPTTVQACKMKMEQHKKMKHDMPATTASTHTQETTSSSTQE